MEARKIRNLIKTRGGRRLGAGRPKKRNARTIPRSIRISAELQEFLALHGSGIIETQIRKSKEFRQWAKKIGLTLF